MVASLADGYHVREVAIALNIHSRRRPTSRVCFALGEVLIARHYPKEYSEDCTCGAGRKGPLGPPPGARLRILWDESPCASPKAGACPQRSLCA